MEGGQEQERDQGEQAEGDQTRGGSWSEISEQLEGVEIIGIRRKRGKKGDIIAPAAFAFVGMLKSCSNQA